MRADMHYQHTLLGKTLAAWKVGGNILSYEGFVCVCSSALVRTEELPCCFTLTTCIPRWRALVDRVYKL